MAPHPSSQPGIVERAVRQHREAFLQALRTLLRSPVSSVLTILSVAIALALPGGTFAMLNSFKSLAGEWDQGRVINAFLHDGANTAQIDATRQRILKLNGVASADSISPGAAATQLAEATGIPNLPSLLTDSPLPAVIVVNPSNTLLSAEQIKQLAESIRNMDKVADVQMDQEWVEQLFATMQTLQRFAVIISVLFGLTVIFAVSGSVRHAVAERQQEIEVTKLVGGSPEYIQRPFLYTAAFLGIFSALAALALIKVALLALSSPLSSLLGLYGQQVSSDVGLPLALVIIIGACSLAMLSAMLTVRMEIRQIEPS